jgi:hypothetical protein
MRAIAFQWQLVALTFFSPDEKFDFKIACVRFTGQRENGAHLFFFQRPPSVNMSKPAAFSPKGHFDNLRQSTVG